MKGRGRTTQGAGPNPNTGITARTTPAIQHSHRANKRGTPAHRRGTPAHRRGVHQHCRPSPTMPPTTTDTPALPRWPHPPPRRGGSRQRIPHRTTAQTHTHHPHTTAPGNERYTTRTAVLASTAMGRAGHEPHHCTGQDTSTPPPFHTPRRMDTIHSSTHPLITHSRSHNQRTIMINMINDQ